MEFQEKDHDFNNIAGNFRQYYKSHFIFSRTKLIFGIFYHSALQSVKDSTYLLYFFPHCGPIQKKLPAFYFIFLSCKPKFTITELIKGIGIFRLKYLLYVEINIYAAYA